MSPLNLTISQALKILWSFAWRGWLLMLPLMAMMAGAMSMMIHLPKPGEPPRPFDPKLAPMFLLIWLVMMVGFFVAQAFALRWALAAKRKGFRIELKFDTSEEYRA